jgi:hypothetical protein
MGPGDEELDESSELPADVLMMKHWRVKDIPDPGDTPFVMLFSPVWWKHWRKP